MGFSSWLRVAKALAIFVESCVKHPIGVCNEDPEVVWLRRRTIWMARGSSSSLLSAPPMQTAITRFAASTSSTPKPTQKFYQLVGSGLWSDGIGARRDQVGRNF